MGKAEGYESTFGGDFSLYQNGGGGFIAQVQEEGFCRPQSNPHLNSLGEMLREIAVDRQRRGGLVHLTGSRAELAEGCIRMA